MLQPTLLIAMTNLLSFVVSVRLGDRTGEQLLTLFVIAIRLLAEWQSLRYAWRRVCFFAPMLQPTLLIAMTNLLSFVVSVRLGDRTCEQVLTLFVIASDSMAISSLCKGLLRTKRRARNYYG